MSESNVSIDRAYRACVRVAREHYENFPVASWLVPRSMRHHVAAVYAFARYADDIADEGEWEARERLQRLAEWRARLLAAVGRSGPPVDATDDEPHLVCVALGETIRHLDLPVALFDDLLSAFCQDVTVCRYDHWDELLDYCRRSADPVGRLVLRIAGYRDDTLDRASDNVCSALQLTNFLQDLDIDWRRGRLYVPADLYQSFGATVEELEAPQLSESWTAAIADMVARTRRCFNEGRSVCDAVGGRLGFELRLTWLGGCRILDRLEWSGYDPRARRPTLGPTDGVPILWKAVTW